MKHRRIGIIIAGAVLAVTLLAVLGSVTRAVSHCTGGQPVLCTAVVGQNPVGIAVDSGIGHAFVVNRDSGTLSMLDTSSGAVVHTTAVGNYALGPLVAERAGRVFVYRDVISPPGVARTTLTMLDARRGDVVRTINIGVQPTCLAIDEHTDHLFIGTMANGVVVLDAYSGRIVNRIPVIGAAQRIVVDETQGHAFVITDHATSQGTIPLAPGPAAVSVIDIRSGRILRIVGVGRSPEAAAVDSKARRLFVVNAEDNTVSVLDTRSGTVVQTLALGRPVRCRQIEWHGCPVGAGIAVDVSVHRVIVADTHDALAHIFDARSGRIVKVVRLGTDPNRDWWGPVAVDEESHRAFAVGVPGMRVLDLRSGHVLRAVNTSGSAVVVDSRTGHVFVMSSRGSTSWAAATAIESLRSLVGKDSSGSRGSVSTVAGRG